MSEYILNEAQEAWLTALESGEYEQARGLLFDGNGFCCIGVACKISGLPIDEDNRFPDDNGCAPESIRESLKLRSSVGHATRGLQIDGADYSSLVSANDGGCNFKQIARAIRSDPTAVFKD